MCYKDVTYGNLLELLDENKNPNIQAIFQSQDPNFIAETYIKEIKDAVRGEVSKGLEKLDMSLHIGMKYDCNQYNSIFITQSNLATDKM